MATQILLNTPYWVWGILLLVLWRGYALTRPHSTSRGRLLLMPCAFVVLSLLGVVTTFGLNSVIVASWSAGFAITATTWSRLRMPSTWALRNQDHTYWLSGSWVPFAIILLAFCLRYGIGIVLAFHSELRDIAPFGAGCAFISGCLTGAFLGRSLNIVLNATFSIEMRNANG